MFKTLKPFMTVTCFFLFIAVTPVSITSEALAADVSPNSTLLQNSTLTNFNPQPQSSKKLDYQHLDYILENTVFYLGLSDRKRRGNRNAFNNGKVRTGIGHKSPYRMEGSRIYLKNLPPKFDESMKVYREDLQNLATSLPITHLSRDEQLAFWLNIHNLATIELLSQQRRARYTTEKRFGPQKENLQDVKLVEIGSSILSLRDIREKIVYQNWDDPKVMYGFFLGDLGGPALQNSAFTGDTVNSLLQENAAEFVNSLRGFEIHKGHHQVSELYNITAPSFFPHFNRDLKKHFKEYMRPEVYALVEPLDNFPITPYEFRVASISAGRDTGRTRIQVTQSYDPNTNNTYYSTDDISNSRNAFGSLLRDVIKKRERLREMGLLENEVTIEDIETEDK